MVRPSTTALALAALVALAGTAHAQTLNDQVGALAAHAEDHATAVQEDPNGFAANATDPAWQGAQVNFTRTWACETVAVASDDAAEAVGELGLCPPVADEAAGPDAEQDAQAENDNGTVAEAEELGNDTATAVEDQLAATEAFLLDVAEDPGGAPGALEVFVNRTLAFARGLLGLPGRGLDVAGNAVASVVSTVAGLGAALGGAAGDAVVAVAHAIGGAGAAAVDAAKDAWAALEGPIEGAYHGLAEAAAGVAGGVSSVGETLADTVGSLTDLVKALLPGGPDDLPVRGGGQGPTRGVGDAVGGFADGLDLPLDV